MVLRKATPGTPTGGTPTTVVDSVTNGNIVVNGAEIQVYNDLAIQNALSGKASTTHTHVLANITDFDTTNKTNGYAPLYDTAVGKLVLKPLPAGTGSGATSMAGLSDVDVTTVAPIESNVLTYQSGKWKPGSAATATGASSTYIVELSRWGIVQGFPTKRIEVIGGANVMCYADADYAKALNNMVGFNNAFDWAASQHYTKVLIPFGNYSVCYSYTSDNDKENMIVVNQSNMSIDLNYSTFKVMFDSAKRSPYNKMLSGASFVPSTNPIYEFSGGNTPVVMMVRDCNYTEVKNGKLIGDKIDRDWVPGEKAMDNTYGLLAGGGCKYINIEAMDIAFFMGDGLSVSGSKNNAHLATGYGMGWVVGDLIFDTNPRKAPLLSTATTGGSLPDATYYVSYTWVNAKGETKTSEEAWITTTGTTSTITATIDPLPANITSANFYIGTTAGAGAGTKQNTAPVTSTNYTQTAALVVGASKPTVNSADGALIPSTNHCASNFIAVTSNTPYYMQGYAYTQGMTALRSRKYTVYMYDANKIYLTQETSFVLKEWTSSKLAKFIRVTVEESTVDPDGWLLQIYSGIKGSFLTFQNNYIHHNHRGGSSPGVNDMFIINNHYYNNGEYYDYDNNLPGFDVSTTRYHINMEDNIGFNMHCVGNKFEGGFIGIAARGYDWTIKDNWFKDCSVVLYRLIYCTLKDNYFEGVNSGITTFEYNTAWTSYQDYVRFWDVEGNAIEGNVTFPGTAVVKNVSNNMFHGGVYFGCDVDNFRNNRFKIDLDAGYSQVLNFQTITKFFGCSFIKSTQSMARNSMTFANCALYDCTIKNMRVQIDNNVAIYDSVITDTSFNINASLTLKFDGCKIIQGTYVIKSPYSMGPDNQAFVMVAIDAKTVASSLELKDCDIVSTSGDNIFSSQGGTLYPLANIKLTRTKIDRQVNNKLGLDFFGGTVSISDTQITAATAVPAITPNAALTHRFSDNTFTNVTFNIKTSDIVYTQQDIGLLVRPLTGTAAPSTVVPQKLGQEYYDTTGKKLYKAFGTTSASDWVIMN